MTLPDPMELEPPDPPEEGHDKPYWLRETTGDRRLILHDADGTILGWVERYEQTPYYVAMIGSDTN